MSGKYSGLVWESYPGGGNDFKLALALADGADDEGYVYIEATLRLLHQARLTESAFHEALGQMQAKGWLTVVEAQECLYRLGPPLRPMQRTRTAASAPKLSLVR